MMISPHPSLIRSLRILSRLADDTGAEWSHTVVSDGPMTKVTVMWDNAQGTGLGSIADLPREVALVFGPDDEGTPFCYAAVAMPDRWIWAIDEGLTEAQADDEARRIVVVFPAVVDYLLARPFSYVKRGAANTIV